MKGPIEIVNENRRAENAAFTRWVESKGACWRMVVEALIEADSALHTALHEFIPHGHSSAAQSAERSTRHALELLKETWRAEAEVKRGSGKGLSE